MTSTKPRLLLLAPQNRYINPTEELLFGALDAAFEVTRCGPGYRHFDALHEDARVAFEREGPFDLAILHQYFFLDSLAAADRECAWPFDVAAFLRRFPRFGRGFAELPCLRVVPLTRMDYYAVDAALRARLEAFAGCFLTWPADYVPPVALLEDLGRERFSGGVSDHYHEFASANRARIFPMMHVMAAAEVGRREGGARRYDVAVPGQRYAGRFDARRALAGAGLRLPPAHDWVPWLGRALRLATGRGLHGYGRGIDLAQRRFRRLIERAEICYTDGSRLRWPVRKFFEIPAWGSVLLADPFHSHESLGFRDGANFVAAAPRDILERAVALLRDPARMDALRKAGTELVRTRHTAEARVREFRLAVDAALAGRYAGAQWRPDGFALVLPERQAPA